MDYKQEMYDALNRLPKPDLERLLYHAEKDTRICCGDLAYEYTDGYGGG